MKKWKVTGKRIAGLVLTLCMVVTGLPAYTQEVVAASQDSLLVHYDFEELNGSVANGTAIKDVSGNQHDAQAMGNNLTAKDGVLTLPGGGNGSGAGYVELPRGMFDGQETLTISIWMKNETGANNYTGFFIGTEANSNGYPTQYFLLNPKNPSNVMKAVLTNTVNASAPYNTEVGVGATGNASDGPVTTNDWALYTVVITSDSITGYLDGVKHKTYSTSKCIADFGNDLVSYIGKSPYPDMFYKGGVRDLKIYTEALTDAEVKELYLEGVTEEELLDKAKSQLTISELSGDTIHCNFVSKLTLPTSIDMGKSVLVTWESSNPEVITADGVITEPQSETVVTLTAKLTLENGASVSEKTFQIRVLPKGETTYSMTVDPENEGVEISQELIGLFFEDINSAADGGLYPEMVKNNSFENYFNVVSIEDPGRGNQYSWKLHWVSDQDDNFVVEQDASIYLNENNTNYAKVTGNMTLKNGGFAPMNDPNSAAMPITEGGKFDFSIWTRADASYGGTLKVRVVNERGNAITDEKEIELVHNGSWQKAEAVLTGTTTQKGKLEVTISGAKDTDVIYLDMISLSPQDTYGYGNKNYAYGKGVRKDLVEKLMALNPSFVRFPGGCIIEGNSGRESYYNWEWSIGPLEERKPIANHWASDNGSYTNTYGYMQSFGFGYHEILTLCEDMGAEPFPILSAGVFCQFANGDNAPAASGEELDKFAQHATHLIDYCWGSPLSTDETQKEWATKRVENGHESPFNLNYIGIGNENWGTKYLENFDYIKKYVEDYVAENYPGRTITIISSAGPAAEDWKYQDAWDWFNEKYPGETLVDEHYYQSKEFMLNNDDRYDFYTRLEDGGSDVFLGEYATHLNSRNNNLESAICDAAYMTGVERNGDIVRHASYAPLFEKIGGTNWSQNMIHFDEYESFATPNYYVQQMFSQNYGTQIVNTTLEKKGENYTQNTGSPIIGTWATAGYVTHVKVTRADGTVLLDDDFSKNGAGGMTWEGVPGSTGNFTIANGRMTFTQGSGMNCAWLPDAVDNAEWYDYKVEATVVKTGGSEGFLVGAGAKDGNNFYWYNLGGWSNTMTAVQRARTDRGTVVLGNNFKYEFEPIKTNEEMDVTFNYGIGGKLEAGYTSTTVDQSDDFSGNLRPYQNDIYQVSSKDDEYIYLKLVNHDDYAKDITLTYPCELTNDQAEIICLSGSANDVNDIGNETVVPVTTTQTITDHQLKYQVPAMSFTVIKVAYEQSENIVTSVTLDKTTAEVEEGQSVTLTATVEATGDADKTVTWSSSNQAVATVENGKVTGVKAGTAVITAKAGDQTATCTVIVKAKTGVVPTPTPNPGGDSQQPTVTKAVIKLNATQIPLKIKQKTKAVVLKSSTVKDDKLQSAVSSNKKIATAKVKNGTLQITGKKRGTATITVTSKGGGTAKVKVKVQKKKVVTKKLKLSNKKLTLKKGKKAKLTVTRKPITGIEKLKWTSSNKKVATVSAKGVVTAKKKGKATITVKLSNKKKAVCRVTVK